MEQELIRLGFSQSEAKIYLELLKTNSLLAGGISKNTGINRRTIYDSLERLQQKGVVGFNISGNKKHFFAINPEVILKNVEEMKESAKELIPKLKNISLNKNEVKVILYNGKKGIKNILSLILESKEYVSYGSTEQFPKIMLHDYELFQNMKNKLKIKNRTILSSELKEKDILKTISSLTNLKFIPAHLTGPTSTFIFNNKVAIFIWEEPYFGILIESKNVYDSYLEYFNELWKIAKK